ncbi:MAG: hypothetical protein HY275_15375 [Gemmatimonadetes bacterium]|nr:hypothetical protein [Gemmatimonadota bacterium]
MRRPLIPLALATLVVVAACDRRPSDAAFRTELLARVQADQGIRERFAEEIRRAGQASDSTARRMLAVDSANTRWLKPIVLRWGFPTRAQVGKEGVEAAFLLVQHADHDPAFQEAVLPMLEQAYAVRDVPGQDVAMLTDRVLKARGKKQRFGTQMTVQGGRVLLDPVEDSANLEARRARLHMVPMSQYLHTADSVFGAPTKARAPTP